MRDGLRTQSALGKVAPSPHGDGVVLFAPGYVDDILFDKQAFENASAYVLDNARRLAVKRLFTALQARRQTF